MTIKFICSCGKHLRARDEMASRRSVCPRCGAPIGVPSLHPNHPGDTLGPMTPDERRRARKPAPPVEEPDADEIVTAPPRPTPDGAIAIGPSAAAPQPIDPDLVHVAVPERARRRAGRKAAPPASLWAECLLCPLRAAPVLAPLALGLGLMTGGLMLVLPDVQEVAAGERWLMAFCSLPILLIPAYAFAFLQCVLRSAVAGASGPVPWPGHDLAFVLRSAAAWLVCFLAGPVALAVGGAVYWLSCGDPDLLDGLILAEASAVAVGLWLLLVLAVGQRDRLRDANPLAVARLVGRVGDRLVVAALVAGVAALAHGSLLFAGLEAFHKSAVPGVLLLAAVWLSALSGAAFLMRLMGAWCRRAAGRGA